MEERNSAQRPEFYRSGKFYDHFDWTLLATVERVVREHDIPDEPIILDLMAGPHSHLPGGIDAERVVGLGLDPDALERNPAIDESVIHDLNREPCLPFSDGTFDLVLCVAAVEYMTRPVEVFREAARVLTPGGFFIVASTEQSSPRKAVRIWLESSVQQRVALVRDYFERAGVFDATGVVVSEGEEAHPSAEDSRSDRSRIRPGGDRLSERTGPAHAALPLLRRAHYALTHPGLTPQRVGCRLGVRLPR